jgi:tetratricopeptide (TPR) repeat protein
MAEETPSKYRKRTEDNSGGLTRDEARLGSSTGGLVLDKLDEPIEAQPTLVSIVDQLMPKEDITEMDFGAGLLLKEQRSDRLRELLERAQSLISRADYRPALGIVEEALAVDRTSAMAWALKGRCLTDLRYYEAALRVFSHAREQISDREMRRLILKLESDCVRASTRALEGALVPLLEKGQVDEALKLLGEGLRRQPSNVVFLYHLADLHWRSGKREIAQKILEEAHRHVGRESIDLIVELERNIEFGAHRSTMEAARAALRRGDSSLALKYLDSCAAALQGNEHYQGLRTYAERKRRLLGPLLSSKTQAQTPSAQQQTLRWLLTEEIRQADEALQKSNYERARAALEEAAEIESGCGAVCYRHARVIFLISSRPGAPILAADLRQAEALATQAAADPDYREPVSKLVRQIHELRAKLA